MWESEEMSEEIVSVVITGGRDFLDWSAVHKLLFELYYDHGERLRIAVGDCPTGVDAAVISWLIKHPRVAHKIYKADWKQHGRKAGPLRNALMIDTEKPCVVFAFPGGKGTEHCKGYAKSKGISVVNMLIERKDDQ